MQIPIKKGMQASLFLFLYKPPTENNSILPAAKSEQNALTVQQCSLLEGPFDLESLQTQQADLR